MAQVKSGDKVKVHYTGKLESGDQFDSSVGREPLEFQVGSGQVIKGFDEGLMEMSVGDKKSITIEPDDAYGQRREDFIMDVPIKEFPENIKPEVGQELELKQPDGSSVAVKIVDLNEEHVRLDANHPLAGEVLIFELELVEIVA
ncbi:MAG: peptidylprolyl isomerase [bacterium]|nr:peptidylprolyl isomerase [bacterium]